VRTRIKRQGGERTGRREEENRGGAEKGEEEKTRETGQKGKERKTGKPVEREANKQKQKKNKEYREEGEDRDDLGRVAASPRGCDRMTTPLRTLGIGLVIFLSMLCVVVFLFAMNDTLFKKL
jgi:hypothetical protein